jgi:glycosyltransferase involved in cell wall biosynthesis
MSTKPLGIVIPTHNRPAALLECLAHLENQTFQDFEVVVVDDGSTDNTRQQMEAYQAATPLSIRYVRQENGGPAKARNLGISMLESPICLMLGDDIFASPILVQRHFQAHQEGPEISVAVLGFTRWSTSGQEVTPFMRWLDQANMQFAYPLLFAGAKADWRNFYTSNLSVKTELLRRFAFNEEFPYAAMEDAELGYRIERRFGLEVKFVPEAVADHLHPTTFRQACGRMVRVGYSYGLFYELWPEQKPAYMSWWRKALVHVIARIPWLQKLLTVAVDLLTEAVCPNPLIGFILRTYFAVGRRNQLKSSPRLVPATGFSRVGGSPVA